MDLLASPPAQTTACWQVPGSALVAMLLHPMALPPCRSLPALHALQQQPCHFMHCH